MAAPGELVNTLSQATSLDDLGIPPSIITDLVMRLLFNEGDVSVSRFAEVIRVYPQILDDVLIWMQQEHQVEVAKAGAIGRLSYVYRLTDEGRTRARDALELLAELGMPAPARPLARTIAVSRKGAA